MFLLCVLCSFLTTIVENFIQELYIKFYLSLQINKTVALKYQRQLRVKAKYDNSKKHI